MPLQIRRGTEVQRINMTQPLALGELLYVTNQQRLYVGDGTTIGGVAVTGFNAEDAVDAAGAALVAGQHQNIAFTYGGTQDAAGRIDASVSIANLLQNLDLGGFDITGTGNINITGAITASGVVGAAGFKGSLFADDSSILVDGVLGAFNLNGTVQTDIIPTVTDVGDIGSSTYKFKSLFLNEAISLAGVNLTVSSGALVVDRVKGDVEGSVFLNNSTRLIDGENGNITTSGTIVIGNDLTLSAGSIVSEVTAPGGSFTDSPLTIGNATTPNTIWVSSESNFAILQGLSDSTANSGIEFRTSRGTLAVPLVSQPGDTTAYLEGKGYDGTNYQTAGIFGIGVDEDQVITPGSVPGRFVAAVLDTTGTIIEMTFNSSGILAAPVLRTTGVYADNTARDAAITTPAAGMMILVGTQFQGYTGAAWVALSA